MGRRKIDIQPLTNERNRTVTFTKRKAGLFKKAHELAILCEVDISVIIIGKNHKIYEYSSNEPERIIEKYRDNVANLYESKRPSDYGNYQTKSRILGDEFVKTPINRHRYSSSVNQIGKYPYTQAEGAKLHARSNSETLQRKPGAHGVKTEGVDRHLAGTGRKMRGAAETGTRRRTGKARGADDDDNNEGDSSDSDRDDDDDIDDDDDDDDDDGEENDDDHEGTGEHEDDGADIEARRYNSNDRYRNRRNGKRINTSEVTDTVDKDTGDDYTGRPMETGIPQMRINPNARNSNPVGSKNKRRRDAGEKLFEENDSAERSGMKKSKNKVSTPYIHVSPLDPVTPEQNTPYGTGSSKNVTPYLPSANFKRAKMKDNKRPTLSLQIPTVDTDRRSSDPSTITAADSSNKSNYSSLGKPTGNRHLAQRTSGLDSDHKNHTTSLMNKDGNTMDLARDLDATTSVNNSNSLLNQASDVRDDDLKKNDKVNSELLHNRKEINDVLPSPIFNLTDSSGSNTSNIKHNAQILNNMNNNSTPLPSALFKDRKNLYTPVTSAFLNNLNNPAMMGQGHQGDTPINPVSYFNFNGMSPTQLLTPMFPFPPIPSMDGNSQMRAGNSMRGEERVDENTHNSHGGVSPVNTNNHPQNTNGDDHPNGSKNRMLEMDNATHLHNNNEGNANVPGAAISGSGIGIRLRPANGNSNISNGANIQSTTITNDIARQRNKRLNQAMKPSTAPPFLPPMNSATSVYFPRIPNQRPNPTINTNLASNMTATATANNVEFPSYQGELSALPSRYVDFQSPSTIFANDWQLPIGSTPIIGMPPQPLPLASSNSTGSIPKYTSGIADEGETDTKRDQKQ